MRLAPRTDIEIVCREADGSHFQFDCRLLLLGAHERELRRAFAEAARLFGEIHDDSELATRLRESEEIRRLYEIETNPCSLRMRDAIFREQGPLDSLDLALKFSAGRHIAHHPLTIDQLSIVGSLLPMLTRGAPEEAVAEAMTRRFGDGAGWAAELMDALKREGIVRPSAHPFTEPPLPPPPVVTFLGHSGLLMRSRSRAVVVDPILSATLGSPTAAFNVPGMKLDAICCSHAHWDHCNPDTLLRFDKSTPVLIPAVREQSAFNPPIATMLKLLGFTDVREAELWRPYRFGDIEVVPVPFYGEQDEPAERIDHYTYMFKTAGLAVYGGVDCYRDSFGDMRQVVERLAGERLDVAFLPVSRMTYRYAWGGVNSFCRRLDRAMLDLSFQYTAGPDYAAELAAVCGARRVVPYATFMFSRFAAAPEDVAFASMLRARSRADSFYPLRAMGSIAAADLRNGLRASMRRRMMVAIDVVAAAATWTRRTRIGLRIGRLLRLASAAASG